jgi:L-lysine 6-transaminase
VEGGSLAVENALKAAFDWKTRKNLALGKDIMGDKIIHFKEAFHGRSGYSLSLTNTDPKKIMYFPKFNWPRIINPKLQFVHGKVPDNILEEVKNIEKQAIEQIKQAINNFPNEIAALIIEPIQGEGGDNHFRAEFLQELRNLANKYDFLLIFDEVQTGFGTTGKYWAFEHFGVIPDIISFGKKSQVCGIAASHRLDEVPSVFHVSSRINSTWGGNIVDMVRCTKQIEIFEEENILENATNIGKILLENLCKLEEKFPNKVTNVRGKGMFLAFDLPNTELRNKAINLFEKKNLLCLTCGTKSIRCRPPLNLTKEEAEEAIKRIEKGLIELFS